LLCQRNLKLSHPQLKKMKMMTRTRRGERNNFRTQKIKHTIMSSV
jgi:hypothetical protein